MAIGLTALAFVLEKKEGLYERNLVSGKYNFFVFNGKLLHAYVSVLEVGVGRENSKEKVSSLVMWRTDISKKQFLFQKHTSLLFNLLSTTGDWQGS